jgi:hypothetical protein
LLALLVVAVPAHAGALIDRAAQQLGSDNVYVDPDASPTLSASEAQRLRDRISADGAAPMYVAVMPQRIVGETGGSPAAALLSIGRRVGRSGTYVLVAGRHMDAAATGDVLPRGEARRLRDEARNNWFVAALVFGEGWHNNHHAFPSSARHGLDRGQFDVSWWVIRGMEKLGLVWNVRVPGPEQRARRRIPTSNSLLLSPDSPQASEA